MSADQPPVPKGDCPICGKNVDNGKHTWLRYAGGGKDEHGVRYEEHKWRCDAVGGAFTLPEEK